MMIETIYNYNTQTDGVIEKIINDENLHLNHMVFAKGKGLPRHFSNSNVYMLVIEGVLSLGLDDQPANRYPKGSIVNIPYNIPMNVGNEDDELLEIFVIKAPNPKDMKNE